MGAAGAAGLRAGAARSCGRASLGGGAAAAGWSRGGGGGGGGGGGSSQRCRCCGVARWRRNCRWRCLLAEWRRRKKEEAACGHRLASSRAGGRLPGSIVDARRWCGQQRWLPRCRSEAGHVSRGGVVAVGGGHVPGARCGGRSLAGAVAASSCFGKLRQLRSIGVARGISGITAATATATICGRGEAQPCSSRTVAAAVSIAHRHGTARERHYV
jgi:hypothetical protein